jgi:hypothetical protein
VDEVMGEDRAGGHMPRRKGERMNRKVLLAGLCAAALAEAPGTALADQPHLASSATKGSRKTGWRQRQPGGGQPLGLLGYEASRATMAVIEPARQRASRHRRMGGRRSPAARDNRGVRTSPSVSWTIDGHIGRVRAY